MKKLLLIVALVVLLALPGAFYLYRLNATAEDAKRWLSKNAIPLKTTEPGRPLEDMQPLVRVISNARVVAVGEATHGTREFWRFKHRMFEFLVRELDFTVLAIEADWPGGLAINNYVAGGEGSAFEVLDGLLYHWNTQEFVDLIEWMRDYNANAANARKLKFYGIDGPSSEVAVRDLEEYLSRVDPAYGENASVRLVPHLLRGIMYREFEKLNSEEREDLSAAAMELGDRLDANKDAYISRSSQEDWGVNRHHVTVLKRVQENYQTTRSGESNPVRDRHMAESVEWILAHEGADARVMVWAHNGHVSLANGNWGHPAMGYHLREMFGEELFTFGFAFNQGSFRAYDRTVKERINFTVGPALEGSLDAVLADVGLPFYAVDLRNLSYFSRASRWLSAPHSTRFIGAVFDCRGEERLVGSLKQQVTIGKHYDGLIFVDRTSAPVLGQVKPPSSAAKDCSAI